MLEWWVQRMRDQQADRAKALAAVGERADAEARERLGDYDAFVEPARARRDGLLLGTARSSSGESIPMRLAWGEEYVHWLVQGGTGTGKTTWVASVLNQELLAGRPVGVIDCKGDLFRAALSLAASLARRPSKQGEAPLPRPVIVNPFSDQLVPLNVCRVPRGSSPEGQAFEVTLAFSRLFDVSLGLHMESILRHLILLLIEAKLSIVEAPRLLQDEVLRGVLAARSSSAAVKEFFLLTWRVVPQASKDALLARLQAILFSENLRLMLGADEVIDLGRILDEGDPLFVFLGKGPGIPEEQVEVLGNLFLQLLFQAVYGRSSGARPYLLIADEFFHIYGAASPALARRLETALTTSRSFGLSLALVHHNFSQLPASLREIMLGNCDLVALFRTNGQNARRFGDFLPDVDPETVQRGSASDLRAGQLEAVQRLPDRHAWWYDRRRPHRAVRLALPDFHLPAEQEAPRETVGAGPTLLLSRAELGRQIEARRRHLDDLLRPRVEPSRSESKTPPAERAQSKPRRPRLG